MLTLVTVHRAGPNLAHVDGQLLRSAQLDAPELAALIEKEGLRTVVNLRGPEPDEGWYVDEERVCAERGVRFCSIDWSSRRLPERDEVLSLLEVFDQGPYPMLVHCRAGADRTGLAATLYRHHVLREPLDRADDSMSLWYGHVSLPWGAAYQVDHFLELYRESGATNLVDFLRSGEDSYESGPNDVLECLQDDGEGESVAAAGPRVSERAP